MLPRGTTPEIPFKFKIIKVEDITACYLSIYQNNEKVLEKDLTQAISIDTDKQIITWRLTQTETLAFDEQIPLEIQIKYKTDNELVYTSKVYRVESYRDLKGEVI